MASSPRLPHNNLFMWPYFKGVSDFQGNLPFLYSSLNPARNLGQDSSSDLNSTDFTIHIFGFNDPIDMFKGTHVLQSLIYHNLEAMSASGVGPGVGFVQYHHR